MESLMLITSDCSDVVSETAKERKCEIRRKGVILTISFKSSVCITVTNRREGVRTRDDRIGNLSVFFENRQVGEPRVRLEHGCRCLAN